MKAKVCKWGNSLAVRIPSSIAGAVSLVEGTEIELSTSDDKVIIFPSKKYDLKEMLAGVSDENRHDEWKTGGTVGNEAW
jgi:antitoxin MazE